VPGREVTVENISCTGKSHHLLQAFGAPYGQATDKWSVDEKSVHGRHFLVTPVFEAADIVKNFGATRALRGASLRLFPGRVHALLGENGAGKSTLVKVVVGALVPDSGTLRLSGRPVAFRSVREAMANGIVPIYQHLSLFPHLSVHENLSAFALGSTTRTLASRALIPRAQAQAWLNAVGLDVDPDTPVCDLSIGERQLLEIARGIGRQCRLLVLDEPTAALSHDEARLLFAVMRRLCENHTAILFISHKLDEIDAIADEVTVLRDGRAVVAGQKRAGLSRSEMVRAMLGESVAAAVRSLPEPKGEPVLAASNLRLAPGAASIDCAVRSGEIVGLTGLVGSGVLDIAAALAAARPAAGRLIIAGNGVRPGDRRRAIALGVGYVPGDRHAEGIFPVLTALQNASASIIDRIARAGVLSAAREGSRVLPWLRRMKLSPLRPDLPAAAFSGGNQQKLVLARNLAIPGLRALVILEPTRGVDIAARETIHDAIVAMARKGVAILLASSDLDEVMALAHRILVVRRGRIEAELPGRAERARLLDALAGRAAA
jgi:ABC-type sugar transport system ATPase subunit